MTNPKLNQNKTISKPTMKDLLDQWARQVMLNFNCHAIATIESFDSEERTIMAQVNYARTIFTLDALGVPQPQDVSYPALVDCPVIVLGGGTSSLRFPIAKGDECLILFNDRDIDNWMEGATSGPVASQRLHSFSDAIALVGFNFDSSSWDMTRASLQNGDTRVAVSSEKVLIENGTTTLNTLLGQLITDIKNLVTQTAAIQVSAFNSVPTNAALITAISTQLTSTATAIGGLLE